MKRTLQLIFIIQVFTSAMYAQVNLQTGAAQIEIPLYSYQNSANSLSLGIGLSYLNGNGLKVTEVASSVGTGWAINCGGSITRIQNGEPDDQKNDWTYTYNENYINYINTYFPNGYIYSEFNVMQAVDNGGAYTPQFFCELQYKPHPKYLTDTEQDVFEFNFNGASGRFIIGKNGVVKQITESPFRIEPFFEDMSAQNIRTRIKKFIITDDKGVKYLFQDQQLDEVMIYDRFAFFSTGGMASTKPNGEASDDNFFKLGTNCQPQYLETNLHRAYKGRALGQYTIGKWFLSEISIPGDTRKINFVYENQNIDFISDVSYSMTDIDDVEKLSLVFRRTKMQTKKLLSVELSASESVHFTYSSLDRKDLPGDQALTLLTIKKHNKIIDGWKFNPGYFARNEIRNYDATFDADFIRFARLCLKSVQRIGSDLSEEKPYVFSYDLTTIGSSGYMTGVPMRLSPFRDHWGYSNMKTAHLYNSTLYMDATGTAEHPADGMLKYYKKATFVTMLTDAATKAPYDKEATRGIIESVEYPLGGKLIYEYEQNKADHNGTDMAMGGVRVKKTILYDGISENNNIEKEYVYTKQNGTSSSGWGYEPYTYGRTLDMKISKCTNASFAGIAAKVVSAAFSPMPIASIISTLIFEIISIFSGSGTKDVSGVVYSSSAVQAQNPLPFMYARVEVKEKNGAVSAGKTIYEFTSPAFHSIEIPTMSAPYAMQQRTLSWMYGLPQVATVVDKDGNMVKRVKNSYSKSIALINDNNFVSRKWEANLNVYGCDFFPTNTSQDWITQVQYYVYTGKVTLSSATEYRFENNVEIPISTVSYTYNSKNYLTKKEMNNSAGDLLTTRYYYPADYTSNTFLSGLVTDNITAPLISTENYIRKDGLTYLTGGHINELIKMPNGSIKPSKSYIFRSLTPVLSTTLQPFSTTNILRDPAYFKEMTNFKYDAEGNSAQIGSANQLPMSQIYSEADNLSIATGVNTNYESIAHTSFEKNAKGKWTMDDTKIIATDALTGSQSFKFLNSAHTKLEWTMTGAQLGQYKLSFWSKGSAPWVYYSQGGSSVVLGSVTASRSYPNTNTGWTFYEYLIPQPSKIIISNSASSGGSNPQTLQIDEVRAYPATSFMSTFAYDEVGNKISENNGNNVITFFKYDVFGRLIEVFDENKNMTKSYEYNIKQ